MTALAGSQALILAIDTSSPTASVALVTVGAGCPPIVRAVRRLAVPGMQTRMLLGLVEETLSAVEADRRDLAAVAVGVGPGTFTGVRIGVASARAAALALDIPVVGVSSLSALAAAALDQGSVPPSVEVLVPVVDARRGQVFADVYRRTAADGMVAPSAAGDRWVRRGITFAAAPEELAPMVAGIAELSDTGRSVAARCLYVGHVGLLADRGGTAAISSDVEAGFLIRGQSLLAADTDGDSAGEGAALVEWLTRTIEGRRIGEPSDRPGTLGTPESVTPAYVRAPDADQHIKRMRDPWQS